MKQRFTFLDIRTIVNELRDQINKVNDNENDVCKITTDIKDMAIEVKKPLNSNNKLNEEKNKSFLAPVIGTYIQNIYSTNQRTFFLKTNKSILQIEVSHRMNLTKEVPPGNHQITFFCSKLRQRLRRKKIKDLHQVGFDREVVLDFGEYILVAQFFAAGNLILLEKNSEEIKIEVTPEDMKETKKNKKIREIAEKITGKHKNMTKDYTKNEESVDFTKKYKIIEIYRPVPELNLQKGSFYRFNPVNLDFKYSNYQNMSLFLGLDKELNECVEQKVKERIKDHRVKGQNVNEVNLKELNEEEIVVFEEFFGELKNIFEDNKYFGKIIKKKNKPLTFFSLDTNQLENIHKSNSSLNKTDTVQNKSNEYIFKSFNECVNNFYNIDKKKTENISKKDKIRIQQLKYIEELKKSEQDSIDSANLIAEETDFVKNIFQVLQFVKKNKIDWQFFHDQKENEDELFKNRIRNVDFLKNTVVVRFNESKDLILNFQLSVHKNINLFFDEMKKKKQKRTKIENNLETILANIHERKNKKTTIFKPTMNKRKSFWFEKYHFTITRNNYLVIGGKNSSQNELLGKKKFDVFFHADINGGSVCTIDSTKLNISILNDKTIKKTNIQRITSPIPLSIPLSDDDLIDASQFALIHSNAWKEKRITETIFVNEDQVSKSALTGEFIKKGGFVVRGKKGFVHNIRMEYGIAILFCIENDETTTDDNSFQFISHPNEEVKFAMPICGSYECMSQFKFHYKLVPGKYKKGKIMKELFDIFVNQANESEKVAIKNILPEEWHNVILSDSRTSK